MRKLCLLSASIAATAILVGCGGGGGGSTNKVTRTVAGFVYVLGSTGSASPDAVIIPSAVAPAGFFAPTAGSVTLSVADGVITRSPDSETFNMTGLGGSNAIICSVTAKENDTINVSGSGLQYNGSGRSFSAINPSIGVNANSGTVLTLNTGTSVYTPGPAASIKYTINGLVPTDPLQAFISGAPGYILSVIALDASGVIVPTATFTTVATNANVSVSGAASGPFTITAASTATAPGLVDVTIDTIGANIQATINGDFTHGTATTVNVTSSATSVLWGTTAPVVANTTANITATVLNQFGAAMPNQAVAFTNAKAPANTWTAAPGTCFTAIVSPTNGSGQATAVFNPPDAIGVPPAQLGSAAKGASTIVATSGSASGNVSVAVLRPIGALVIGGDTTLDTATGASTYSITGATDVDGDVAAIPSGGVTWTLTNVPSGGNIGNTGDASPASVSNATGTSTTGSINITPGGTAGQFTLLAAIGTVNSNTITTDIYGVPSKIVFNPNTAASVIPGANGEYVSPGTGTNVNVTFTFLDSFGHTVGNGGNGGTANWNYTGNIGSATGGSLNPGTGANNAAFLIVTGPGDGLFTITTQGSWTGNNGGSGNFNLQRNAGHNAP